MPTHRLLSKSANNPPASQSTGKEAGITPLSKHDRERECAGTIDNTRAVSPHGTPTSLRRVLVRLLLQGLKILVKLVRNIFGITVSKLCTIRASHHRADRTSERLRQQPRGNPAEDAAQVPVFS